MSKSGFGDRGFTFVEVFSAVIISSFIIAALFYALNTGEYSKAVSSAKIEVQSEVRRSVDWIARDVRQTVSWDIADAGNSPTDSHIKFRQVQGWDIATGVLVLTDDYVEYTYDPNAHTITRRLLDASGNVLGTWMMKNIVQPPFYTRDNLGNMVPLSGGNLLTSRVLVVAVSGEKQVRPGFNVAAALTEEVKIRNE